MKEIKRHSLIVRLEHWVIALSGIMLIFTGLGCLPLFKRYFITDIPVFGWTADFYLLTSLHYLFAILFTAGVFFHLFYHLVRKDFGLIPKIEDFKPAVKILLATFGLGKEPPSGKWLAEQKFAYLGIASAVFVLVSTGILKVLKNLKWVYFPPTFESMLNLFHTLFGGLFILLFFIHLFFVLAVKANRQLLKSMITGKVSLEYVKHRHTLWYEKIAKKLKRNGAENIF